MISTLTGSINRGVNAYAERRRAGFDNWLSLAAAPIFAIMAVVTWMQGGGMPDMLCVAMHDPSPLTGMVPMYVLMSALHSSPWLKLIANRRGDS